MRVVAALILFTQVSASSFPDTLCLPALSSVDLVKERKYDLKGKTAVITGGDSGIGFGTAMGLATAGARMIMLSHNVEKGQDAADNITRDTGNADITVLPINLASFGSVRKAVTQVLDVTERVDVLVCDAGQNFARKGSELTEDGFESTFQVTFLSHFLLTELLLPVLRKSGGRVANAGCDSNDFVNQTYQILVPEDGTVCARSSSASNCTDLRELERILPKPLPAAGGDHATYAFLAMFMKTFYTRELSSRSDGVPAYAAHPGSVATPGLPADQKNTDRDCPYPTAWYACNCWSSSNRSYDKTVCPLTPLRGSNTLAFLATAPAKDLEASNGRMFAACEVQHAPLDQFNSMEQSKGTDGAMAYARDLVALWYKLTKLKSAVV